MPLEFGTYISDLNASNPLGVGDTKAQGDDHLRLIKATIKNSFPNIDGAVTPTPTELNRLAGLTGLTGTGNLVASASPTFTGTVTAATVSATTLTGAGSGITALNASNLASGTVPDARFPATLPALDGSALTNLNASSLASGSVPDARLGNAALVNAANVFTSGTQTIRPGAGVAVSFRLAANAGTGGSTSVDFEQDVAGAGYWYNRLNAKLEIGTNNTARMVVDGSGNFDFKAGTVTTSNASAAEVGFKGLPRNVQNAGYTLVLADAGKVIYLNTNGTFTIPANGSVAFPVGTAISLANLSGAACTIAITTDTLQLAGTSSTGSRTLAAYGLATILKTDADRWLISGAGLS